MNDEKPKKLSECVTHAQVEDIVQKSILEAKLAVTESRVNWILVIMGGLVAVLGVVVPILWTQWNDAKVEQAIEKMENRFKELAGEQLRKPQVTCEFEGKPLLNADVVITAKMVNKPGVLPTLEEASPVTTPSGIMCLRNTGDRSAGEAHVYVSVSSLPDYLRLHRWEPELSMDMEPIQVEKDASKHTARYLLFRTTKLHAQSHDNFGLVVRAEQPFGKEIECPALLEVFYDAPEPLKIPFNIRIVSAEHEPMGPSDSNTPK